MRKATHPFHLPGNRRHGKAACITASGFRGCCSMSHIHRGVTSAFRYFSRITAARSLHLFISRHGRDATKADHAGDSHHIFISRLCARCNCLYWGHRQHSRFSFPACARDATCAEAEAYLSFIIFHFPPVREMQQTIIPYKQFPLFATSFARTSFFALEIR